MLAHTSEETQPLDVTLFSVFKGSVNEEANRSVSRIVEDKWSVHHFCGMLSFAYYKAFTAINIRSGFIRSDI